MITRAANRVLYLCAIRVHKCRLKFGNAQLAQFTTRILVTE
jgi:hypothetical protein